MNAKQKKLGLIIAGLLGAQVAYALPQGAQVVHGTASFSSPNSSTLNVTNSNNAVINWQQFNIGAGQTTNFIQPSSSSSVLNKVISNNPSQILGNLNSNGQVYLINQYGILVGEGARINTNGFFASTLNITNEDFLNGKLTFSEGGLGDIYNKGYIHAGEDGNVVLVAPNIENGGVIEVDNGNIILAAGESITITSLDNSNVEFLVQSTENNVTNLGSVIAKNGAASLFAGTLKHSGSIRATGLVRDADGKIRLVALDKAEVSGSVDVSGENAGNIEILGDIVEIQQGANINASGSISAGEILIGGDQQGLNPNVKNAASTTVAIGAQVRADGLGEADGGRVIVFASNDVHIQGDISATGGAIAGDGGFIETSGLKQLDITSIPDASAANGNAGEWLIDPNNITIQAAGSDTNITNVSGVIDTTDDGAILTTGTIVAALDAGTNVTISTGAVGTNLELGDININDPINSVASSVAGNLTLNAHNDINVNSDITFVSFNSIITLNANSDADATGGGSIVFANALLNSNFGDINLSGDAITVTGITSFVNESGTVNLSSPLTIDASNSLTIGSGNSAGSTLTVQGASIINNGTLTTTAGCGDGCGSVNFLSSVTNNGTMAFDSGITHFNGGFVNNSDIQMLTFSPNFGEINEIVIGDTTSSIFSLNSGSNISDVSGANWVIDAFGTLNVNTNIALPSSMTLTLNQGVMNSFENLILPSIFNITGGTINFNENVWGFYDGLFSMNITGSNVLSFNGSANGNVLMYLGTINWAANTGGDIFLNNTDFTVADFNINNASSGLAKIEGSNGSLEVVGIGRMLQSSLELTNITVPVTVNGEIAIDTGGSLAFAVGDLALGNGGKLTGAGTYVGNVVVNSGGIIAPGISGDVTDNTGTLNVTGNVTFNNNSSALFELDAASDGTIGTFDQLSVDGSVVVNSGSNLFLFWDNVIAQPLLSNQLPFDLMTVTGTITGVNFSTIVDPLLVTASTTGLSSTAYQYDPGSLSGSLIFWDNGAAASNNWEDALNWSNDLVPSAGDQLVVESSLISINASTNAIGFSQLDGDIRIEAGGIFNSSGNVAILSSLSSESIGSTMAGTGTLYNFGSISFLNAGFDLSINVNNYGAMYFGEVAQTTANFTVTSNSFNNYGDMLIFNSFVGNEVDFSGSSSGLVNNGKIRFLTPAAEVRVLGGLDNFNEINVGSITNTNTQLIFANNNTNGGDILLYGTELAFDNGATYSFASGSSISGLGVINIGPGAILNINGNFTFGLGQTVNLAGGAIQFPNNVTIDDNFNFSSGTLEGFSTGALITSAGSYTTLGSGLDTVLNNVDWINNETVDWVSSGGDFVINNGTFTNSAFAVNTFNVLTSSINAEILGTGSFVNDGVFRFGSTAPAESTTIDVVFTNNGTIDLDNDNYVLSLSGDFTNFGNLNFNQQSIVNVANLSTFTIDLNAAFNETLAGAGSKFVILQGSTLNVANTSYSFEPNLNLDISGNVTNAQNMTVLPNQVSWDSGTISGIGSLNIASATTLLLTGLNGDLILDGVNLNTAGAVTFTGNGNDLLLDNNAIWVNAGTFTINNGSGASNIQTTSLATSGQFVNTGIVNSDPQVSTDNIDFFVPIDNQGTINVLGDIFEISRISTNSGTINISAGATFTLGSSLTDGINNTKLTLSGTPIISGSGLFEVNDNTTFDVAVPVTMGNALSLDLLGGLITNAQNLKLPGVFNWEGGVLAGNAGQTMTAPSATTVNMLGLTNAMSLDSINLLTLGTVNYSASLNGLILNNDATWDNAGTLNMMGKGGITATNSTVANFINTGVFNFSVLGLEPATIATNFDSQGVLNINSGNLNLASSVNFSNDVNIAKNSILGLSGGINTNVAMLDGSAFIGQGRISSTANVSVADAVNIDPQFRIRSGAVSFEGGSSINSLLFDAGIINVDTLGGSSSGDTLVIGDLTWLTGSIIGDGSAGLSTSGSSYLNGGTLQEIDWVNSGILNWVGLSSESLLLVNASFTNAATGTLNIRDIIGVVGIGLDQRPAQIGLSNKGLSLTNSNFINEGRINLFNANLNLGGATLNLATSTAVLNGTGSVTGNVVNSNGLVSMYAADTAGSLLIDGNYTQGANGTLKIRIVDPINGNFQYDSFAVSGLATLAGTLELQYFSNKVASITESFNPFSFGARDGIFDTLVDSNNNILAIDISNGGFTILGTSSQVDVTVKDVLQSQEKFEKILKIIKDEDLNETLAFIKTVIKKKKEKKDDDEDKALKLVCK